MDKVEVVVVGAGLAGLSAALTLAEAGVEVLVVERGDYPGSKNVTGGRLYLEPVRPYLPPDLWDDAPFERQVVKERLTLAAPDSSVTVEVDGQRFRETGHSYSILRATFDRWLADKAAERGALVVPGYKVDGLLFDGDKVTGIRSGEADIHADVVLSAEGVLGFLAEEAGLRDKLNPHDYAVGVKEIIELPAEKIQDRFNVSSGKGVAQLYFGQLTGGVTGGGFLYTNKDSLSLGMVFSIHGLMSAGAASGPENAPSPHELMNAFKERNDVAPLLDGGHPVEYSAHVVLEGGLHAVKKLYRDGFLLAGDAAGFGQNLGITVRGMDFALASGAMAGQAILKAREAGDYSARTLAYYESLLKDSFVFKDLETFKHMPAFLENSRMFGLYPQAVTDIAQEIFWMGQQPKPRLSQTVFKMVRQRLLGKGLIKDALAARKV